MHLRLYGSKWLPRKESLSDSNKLNVVNFVGGPNRPKWYNSLAMAIKNYTSDKPIERIFAELQQTLGAHGAKQISFDYGDHGKVHGVQFVIKVHDRFIPVKLPAR